jgi:CRP/FNR family transcriptional regulator, nitrogen oxide reductase regulator
MGTLAWQTFQRSENRTQSASTGMRIPERPPMFVGIPATDYASIFAAARPKMFNRGEMIYLKGDSVRQVLLLTAGLAKIAQHGRSGSEVILRLVVPGDVLGAVGLLSSGTHDTTALAFRSCKVLIWDERMFKTMVEHFPVLHQNIVRILEKDLIELAERFRELATEKVSLRVARQLVRLGDKIGRQVQGSIEIGMSRDELARMTGTTLFTVSRLLSGWEACGIVKPSRETVKICDDQLLRAVCEES